MRQLSAYILCFWILLPTWLVSQNYYQKEAGMLDALRKRKNVAFKKKTRILKTNLEFETDFDTIYPGTNKTCAYVLRYFFHTDIHFNKNLNELISMDGTSFVISKDARHLEIVNQAVMLTEEVIKLIGNMYFGYHELDVFLETFPKAKT